MMLEKDTLRPVVLTRCSAVHAKLSAASCQGACVRICARNSSWRAHYMPAVMCRSKVDDLALPDRAARINYPNDLEIDPIKGAIYFTDSSTVPPALNAAGFYDTLWSYILTALQVCLPQLAGWAPGLPP